MKEASGPVPLGGSVNEEFPLHEIVSLGALKVAGAVLLAGTEGGAPVLKRTVGEAVTMPEDVAPALKGTLGATVEFWKTGVTAVSLDGSMTDRLTLRGGIVPPVFKGIGGAVWFRGGRVKVVPDGPLGDEAAGKDPLGGGAAVTVNVVLFQFGTAVLLAGAEAGPPGGPDSVSARLVVA